MADRSLYANEGGGNQRGSLATPGAGAPPFTAGYKFSPEETRVLADCNNESFYQRSLPAGTALGLGAFYAIQQGYLRPNPRFGPYPKVTLGVVVGYFLGKLSYQQACAEKLMALPDSYLGQLLRERRDHRVDRPKAGGTGGAPPSMFGAGPSDIYSDAGPGSALDLDTDRPLFSDDAFSARGTPQEGGAEPPRTVLSYDELRRRNRGDVNKSPAAAAPPATSPTPHAPSPRTNKYGDSME